MSHDKPDLLTSAEVARIFRVDPKTVTRWAKNERLLTIWTPGGGLRFYASEVKAQMLGAGAYPRSVAVRHDLTGHTVTVERLDVAAARKRRGSDYITHVGELAVVERHDGKLTKIHATASGTPAEDLEEIAAWTAVGNRDATYVKENAR